MDRNRQSVSIKCGCVCARHNAHMLGTWQRMRCASSVHEETVDGINLLNCALISRQRHPRGKNVHQFTCIVHIHFGVHWYVGMRRVTAIWNDLTPPQKFDETFFGIIVGFLVKLLLLESQKTHPKHFWFPWRSISMYLTCLLLATSMCWLCIYRSICVNRGLLKRYWALLSIAISYDAIRSKLPEQKIKTWDIDRS